jgi:hypothetical protein
MLAESPLYLRVLDVLGNLSEGLTIAEIRDKLIQYDDPEINEDYLDNLDNLGESLKVEDYLKERDFYVEAQYKKIYSALTYRSNKYNGKVLFFRVANKDDPRRKHYDFDWHLNTEGREAFRKLFKYAPVDTNYHKNDKPVASDAAVNAVKRVNEREECEQSEIEKLVDEKIKQFFEKSGVYFCSKEEHDLLQKMKKVFENNVT